MNPIYNIFSRKKAKNRAKPKVIIDFQEKNSLVISELASLGIETEIKQLKVADYLTGGVAIERKTISDFVSSMINKRLLKQLEELSQYKNRLLIIEGTEEQELYGDSRSWTGMHPNAIRGFLLSITLKYKTPVIFTKNYEDTARFISLLSRKKETEMSLNVSKKSLNKQERMQFILEGFPGIGPKNAKKLLSHFKTLQNIFNAGKEELEAVIGKKAEIFRLVAEKY